MKSKLEPKNITVLGAGSWGTTIAIHLHKKGHKIKLWEYFPENVIYMNKTHRNPLLEGIPIPTEIFITDKIDEVIDPLDYLILAVPSQKVRGVLSSLKGKIPADVVVINLAKGLEIETLKRMSEVIIEVLGHPIEKIVTLHGPSHAEEVSRNIPTAVVVASICKDTAIEAQKLFHTDKFRVYTTTDIIGVEIGGAVKNVIAIAAGISDGLGLGDNTKAALVTRGLAEIIRMGIRFGANEETFSGLSGIGDLIVTCYSKHSRNRYIGEEIGKGRKLSEILAGMSMVAEGVDTAKTVHQISQKYNIVMPISEKVYQVLFEGLSPQKALRELLRRDPVEERHSLVRLQ